jgi:hypothetical protein
MNTAMDKQFFVSIGSSEHLQPLKTAATKGK